MNNDSPLVLMIRNEQTKIAMESAAIEHNMTLDDIVEKILGTVVELRLIPRFLDDGIHAEFGE